MLNSGLLSFEKVKLEARDENNSLSQTIPDKPIELRHFVKLCEQRRKFPVLYKLEFQTAVKVETNTCRHATRKNNVEKNQNQKCIPYDYNRVVLEKTQGVVDSDYVNGSFVDSLLKPNAYIVTQGPTEETVNEFWKLVWQENVSAIVMLTKTFDFTKVMCVQYWPPNIEIHETYGDIHINIVKEEQLANFQIRTFRLYKKNGDVVTEERLILQFHYTEWHSHTCPFSNAVLEFRRRVRAVVGNIIKPTSMIGPMLVHCNDGGGRSGVYLAIDANLELAEEEDCFHVFGYLKKLRQSRKGLIENVEQYKFVYDTLEEHIVCGKTWFPVSELSERLKLKAKKDPITKMNEYQREYEQICKQTPRFTIGDCAGGHRADNREKNRDVLCVPPDNFRPYLTSFQGNAFTDYINSVFVDGYTKPREYIITEWPLKHTLGEFWSLVYDHECSAVVVLCQPPPNSQQYPSFWPQKSKMEKYGPVFTVHFVSGKHYQNIKQWEYKINKKIISLTEMMAGVKAPTKTVRLFQLTCWPLGHKVPTSTNSLVFLMNMVEMWRQRTDYGPVCVVSPDGRSRAGVYCAANACIEQVIQHGEVDVFQAVKTVRRHRPQLIDNMTEYKYCYDLVLHYVLHFLDKDHKEKKFVAFGRGKCIPLTPDNLNSDLPSEISNTGRIIVNKCIDKIDKRETLLQQQQQQQQQQQHHHHHQQQQLHQLQQQQSDNDLFNRNLTIDRNAKILERKKKGRLYSLGGNEPQRKGRRGRLDRLKTVGTIDLESEMCVLSAVARNLNERIITGEFGLFGTGDYHHDETLKGYSSTPPMLSSIRSTSTCNTPEYQRRSLSKSTSSCKPEYIGGGGGSGGGSGVGLSGAVGFGGGKIYHHSQIPSYLLQSSKDVIELKPQHSADDCIQKNNPALLNSKKTRSLSISSYLNKDRQESALKQKSIELKVIKIDGLDDIQKNYDQIETEFHHDDHHHHLLKDNISNIDVMNSCSSIVNSRNKLNIRQESFINQHPYHYHQQQQPQYHHQYQQQSQQHQQYSYENDSKKIDEDICSYEDINKIQQYQQQHQQQQQGFMFKTRKPLLRKSRRIVRTDSEVFNEEIILNDKQEYVLRNNSDIQIHACPDGLEDDNEKLDLFDDDHHYRGRSSVCSRKDSSDFDDICSPREPPKSTTDDSSKNISTDEIDAVFSDSTAELENLEKEYKELIKSNLQREYKSDGDTLDEVGKKRSVFGKWKNQSLEHEFELSTQDLGGICYDGSPSVHSYETSADNTKDISRITSPESCINEAYSDSGVKRLDEKYSTCAKIRSRVYSSSRVGETPTEKERLHPYEIIDNATLLSQPAQLSVSEGLTLTDQQLHQHERLQQLQLQEPKQEEQEQEHQQQQQQQHQKSPQQNRPSVLEINKNPQIKPSNEGTITSLFEKRFGKFKKVNNLLKCKRFSTSTLYDKKKTTTHDDSSSRESSRSFLNKLGGNKIRKQNILNNNNNNNINNNINNRLEKDSINSSKLSLFKEKTNKNYYSLFSCKKKSASAMFTNASSLSNNELFSKTASKTKLSEISKSNAELGKFKQSPSRYNKKMSKTRKTNSSTCLSNPTEVLHSPLSEEFYNKTGSVRLSAMELYEKFCSEDFGGLYKDEGFKLPNDRRENLSAQHELRLEKKGLRTMRRYHKNARLLKQKSEPKFNYRLRSAAESLYYQEEDEYYYNDDNVRDLRPEEYIEQDEYYDEYGGEEYDDDNEEGDYYEDEEESNYYEDDVEGEGEIQPPGIYNPEQYSDHQLIPCPDEILMNQYEIDPNLQIDSSDLEQIENSACGGGDSDVDEIFLMPEDTKCSSSSDYEEYGFENKHFSLEHSMLLRSSNGKNFSFNYIDNVEYTTPDVTDEEPVVEVVERYPEMSQQQHQHHHQHHQHHHHQQHYPDERDDVLTIYKICSRLDIAHSCSDEQLHKLALPPQSTERKHSASNLPFAPLEKAVSDYVKIVTDTTVVEPTFVKTDCISVDRTDSQELLSNSSGTLRSPSTLTDYAFDTVKNLNLDSCSTSKLSLSLKSEVFDELTMTPDEAKPIRNCEIEDFTLTPEASCGDCSDMLPHGEDYKHNTHTCDDISSSCDPGGGGGNGGGCVDSEDDNKSNDNSKLLMDDDCNSKTEVIVLVNEFLTNERNVQEQQTENVINLIKKDLAQDQNSIISDEKNLSISEIEQTTVIEQELKPDEEQNTNKSTSSPTTTTTSSSMDQKLTDEFTIIDWNESDEQTISLFTTELTLEFDRLFSNAKKRCESSTTTTTTSIAPKSPTTTTTTANNLDQTKNITKPNKNINNSDTESLDEINIVRAKIPSRHSMQKLEPYHIADDDPTTTTTTTTTTTQQLNISNNGSDPKYTKIFNIDNNDVVQSTATGSRTTTNTTPTDSSTTNTNNNYNNHRRRTETRLKNNRSQSLGNLNKKTKCFPL